MEPGLALRPTLTVYDAFISYSHAAAGRLAPSLQQGIQSIGKPWYRRRSLRVFRDATNLGAAPELWPSIETAMAESSAYILLLSPEAASSPWVEREVAWWRANRGDTPPMLVLTAGELEWDGEAEDFTPRSSVPPSLRGLYTGEPLWVELRWAAREDHVSLRNPRFRDCVADVAAPLRALPKDELIGEDIRQHRRAIRLLQGGIAALVVLLAMALMAATFAVRQRDQARAQRDTALSRELASEAEDQADVAPALSALLSVAAFERADTVEARAELMRQVDARAPVARIEDRTLRATPRGDAAWFGGATFAPDGVTLVTGVSDGRTQAWGLGSGDIVIWDVLANRQRGALHAGGEVRTLALGPGGRTLASATLRRVAVWDLDTKRSVFSFSAKDDVWAVALSSDGRTLAVGTADRLVTLVDIGDGGRTRTLVPPGGRMPPPGDPQYIVKGTSWPRSLAFSPDGRLIASGGPDQGVHLWDAERARLLHTFVGHGADVTTVAFSRDGDLLASGGLDHAVLLWDVARRRRLGSFYDQPDPIDAVAFAPDGSTVASADVGSIVVRRTANDSVMPWRHNGHVEAVAFDADGSRMASAGEERGVLVWDVARRRRIALLTSDARTPGLGKNFGGMASVAISPDGRLVAGGSGDGMVIVWDVATRRERFARSANLPQHFDEVVAVEFSPDGRELVTSTTSGTMVVWDAARGRRQRTIRGRSDNVKGLAIADDGHRVASIDRDGVVVWDVRDGRLLSALTISAGLTAGALTSDLTMLASTGSRGAIELRDVARGTQVATLRGHGESVEALAFSPDGRTLASAGGDLRLGIWDVARLRLVGFLPTSETPTSVAFDPSGRFLASGESDGSVRLRSASADAWMDRLCEIVDRDLTRGEWSEWVGDVGYRRTCS